LGPRKLLNEDLEGDELLCNETIEECAEKNGRLYKPAYCALCRSNILTRRDLRKDHKLNQIVQLMIPDMAKYRHLMGIYMQNKSGQQLFQEVSQ
jgi:hypothetical protein